MLVGAIASFVLAAIMFLLVGFGFAHAQSTAVETRMLEPTPHKATPVPAA